MAKKETFTLNTGTPINAINLDFRVGEHGENRHADVMLIQSLFQYIGVKGNAGNRCVEGIRLPGVDGICGPVTKRAIRQFQNKHSHRLLRVDGVIHPASYNGRKMADISKPVMTIMLLHFFATDAALFLSDADYFAGLIRIEPRLSPFLR